MVCSLRNAMQRIMGKDKSYLHYYKRIIKDYERGNWNFDIRILITKSMCLALFLLQEGDTRNNFA